MKLNLYLHHVVSFTLLGALYYGVNLLSVYFHVAPDAPLTLFDRAFGIGGLVALYFVLPLLLYSVLKWHLLPQLHVKQPRFLTFLKHNAVLYSGFLLLYTLWNFGGDLLRDPADLVSSLTMILYGILLLFLTSFYITLVQYVHRYTTYERSLAHLRFFPILQLFLLYLISGVLAIGVDAYGFTSLVPLIGLLGLLLYTEWQERLFS